MKTATTSSQDLGDDWRASVHMRQDMTQDQWERLKDIATRRRRLMKMLANLDEEEQRLHSEIER